MLESTRTMIPANQASVPPAFRQLGQCVAALVLAASTSAQDIISSVPREPAVAPVLRELQPPASAAQPPAPPETPFKFGPVVVRPNLSFSYTNAEGLPTQDGRRVASEIFTTAAGLSVDLGEAWTLAYNPSWRNYTARAMQDSFDQSASLNGALAFRDWGFQVSESYSQATPTLVETGQQTKQESWVSSLSTSYSFNPGVQLHASAGMNETYTDIGADMRSWSSDISLNLIFSERLSLNLGPSFTYNEIVDAPDMYDEGYQARLNWSPTNRLTLGVNFGMQYSHSRSSTGIDLSDPVLNFTLGYQPFPTTSISVTASRTVEPSYFGDQVTDTFRWSVGLNQRLFGGLYFSANYAPYDAKYTAINSALAAPGRKDAVKSFNARLATQLFGRLMVAGTYAQTDNESTIGAFSFSTKQYGVALSYSY